jgi:hypothetical protein
MKIEIERYYIFSNVQKGIRYYNSLEDLKSGAPEQIRTFEEQMKDNYYIGIGAEYTSSKGLGAVDFINKKDRNGNFNWCRDVETEGIEAPKGFKEVLEGFIETL